MAKVEREYWSEGQIWEEKWLDDDGQLHREDGPAFTEYTPEGQIVKQEWIRHGSAYREDGPALIYYLPDGKIIDEYWYPAHDGRPTRIAYHDNGKIKSEEWSIEGYLYHREDGPACIHYDSEGRLYSELWVQLDREKRDNDLPAYIQYFPDGKISKEQWYDDGQAHRDNAPAIIEYYDNGAIRRETWCNHGNYHREDSPAYICYDKNGNVVKEEWYRYGELIEPSQLYVSQPENDLVWSDVAGGGNVSEIEGDSGEVRQNLDPLAPNDLDNTLWASGVGNLDQIEREKLVEHLHNQLVEKIEQLAASTNAADWKAVLDFIARMPSYSLSNAMLIAMQQYKRGIPVGEPVAGYNKWQQEGRKVVKGQKGIRIFAPITRKLPFNRESGDHIADISTIDDGLIEWRRTVVGFKAISVFSASQTYGAPLPEAPKAWIAHDLEGEGNSEVWKRLTAFIEKRGYTLRDKPGTQLSDGIKGYTDPINKEIVIRTEMSQQQRFKTLIHECAHLVLHENIHDYQRHRGQYEIEAESVAYIVASVSGIDTSQYSIGYIARWAGGDPEKVKTALTNVMQGSTTLIEAVWPERILTQEKELAREPEREHQKHITHKQSKNRSRTRR
ncbi:ArdC-like ssDNA-binding domain-containing protein [Trueperella sp. LYQ143]|uniref:ArdC-like ssDNA-binding domain-containing protein n=1 Tax=Trueperella sp. LYQ143 TaxID=3391059 RepID=UPI003983B68B